MAELGTFVLVSSMAVGAVPVAAEDCLVLGAGLCCVHTVDPACPTPFHGRGITPVGAIAVAAVELLYTGNPAVDENVMLSLVPVGHSWDDLSKIWCVLRSLSEVTVANDGQPGVVAR